MGFGRWFVGGFVLACWATGVPAAFWRTPYLQNMTPTAVTIMWWNYTNGAGQVDGEAGWVEYGTATYDYRAAADHMITNIFDGDTGIVHRITLENLAANTEYLYRVICGGATNGSSFRTFPAATDYNASVSFAVQGDMSLGQFGWGYDATYRAFCNWQASLRPNAFLLLGDIVSFGEPLLSNAWHSFFTNGAPLLAKCPAYITLGNHEFWPTLSDGYDTAFSIPTNGPGAPHVYSFDCGIAHITVCEINNDSTTHDFDQDSPQFIWITNDLARTSKPWKIVLLHHTVFSSGKYNVGSYPTSRMLTNCYVPEFEKYNVNLCLNGHDHLYEHSAKSNTHYMTLSAVTQYDIQYANPYSIKCIGKQNAAALLAITGAVCTITVKGYSYKQIEAVDSFALTNTAYYYFTVKDVNPGDLAALPIAANQIDLLWSKDARNHNVMVVRKHSTAAWTAPAQGVPYAAGASIGNGLVVYKGGATVHEDTTLSPNTTYDYMVYSENGDYYSAGVTTQATTTPEPGLVAWASMTLLALRRKAARASWQQAAARP